MEPITYSIAASINPLNLIRLIFRWVKSKEKGKYTFSEYFRKIQKEFHIRHLDDNLKEKILDMIDEKSLPDGRQIIVDHSRRRIFIRKFDDF